MRGRGAEALVVAAVAAAMTAVMAAPVLRAPSARLFGFDLVGRHHDPFTVMQQFANPGIGVYTQPVTDWAGVGLSRILGPVAAYNWLVLVSFPLSAAAAYLLGRHLALSRAAAAIAALAYAFAPFHVAQAAYHPHVAQTQWLPLYLLALWRCVDRATPLAIAFLLTAAIAVTLSNFYGGLIAAVVTPVAMTAYWFAHRSGPRTPRGLRATIITLAVAVTAAGVYAWWAAPAVVWHRAAFSVPREQLFVYSAKWWGYLLPPVAHPWLGLSVRRIWEHAGVREGLLEQQVSLGLGIVALGAIAIVSWRPRDRDQAGVAVLPVLVAVALAAAVCSLSPERTIGGITFSRPSGWLYQVLPMFRSYARFGVVVQLMAALLAGLGVDALLRGARPRGRVLCGALVLIAAAEYAVSPAHLWRDVLPTRGHRWLMARADDVRALDCTSLNPESASIVWLTGSRISLMGEEPGDCIEPNLAGRLAADHYTHLLVRRGNRTGRAFFDRPPPPGLQAAAHFRDAEVFTVIAAAPSVYTAGMTGFWPREHDKDRTWRWMQDRPSWTVVNATGVAAETTLDVELSSFGSERRMNLDLDGRPLASFVVSEERRVYHIAAFALAPGAHRLDFVVGTPGRTAAPGDPRVLACAIWEWTWTARSAAQ